MGPQTQLAERAGAPPAPPWIQVGFEALPILPAPLPPASLHKKEREIYSSFNIASIFCFLKCPNRKLSVLDFPSYRHSAGISQKIGWRSGSGRTRGACEVLILLLSLYLAIRGPSGPTLHASGGPGPVPAERFSCHCPGFSADLPSKETSPIVFREGKLISFLKQAEEEHLRGLGFYCRDGGESASLSCVFPSSGSSGPPLWASGGTNQQLRLINKSTRGSKKEELVYPQQPVQT